jgi:polar amino acid transport system permease protein
MVNMTILMLKETAILSIISVPELTLSVSAIGSQHYAFVESFTILALAYWALVELCAAAGRRAEARFSKYRFAS